MEHLEHTSVVPPAWKLARRNASCQSGAAAFALLLVLVCAGAELVASAVRLVALSCALLAALDMALTWYHRRHFDPTQPAPHPERRALITGASSGLGKEMACLLAERGYSLVIAARGKAALERLQQELEQAHKGIRVSVCACDLSNSTGVDALLGLVKREALGVDILVNCAGFSLTGDFLELSTQQVAQILALDVMAVIQLTHALVPHMIARGVGRVLNVGSMAGALVSPSAALYSSSKTFIQQWSQALDYELRGSGVSVTCFCPGPVHTNFGHAADCDRAIYMRIPGTAYSPRACATLALQAMFDGQTLTYDSWFASTSAFLGQCVAPRRLLAAVCAVCMNEPRDVVRMLRR